MPLNKKVIVSLFISYIFRNSLMSNQFLGIFLLGLNAF